MHSLELPAGSSIGLTASARADVAIHRWDLRVISIANEQVLAFGSQIGGLEREQRVDIPAQRLDCRVEIFARHKTPTGWGDDRSVVIADTPSRLEIGFCDPGLSTGERDDISLSLAFGGVASRG